MQPKTVEQQPTKREQELELEIWRSRMRETQMAARALQAEGQLLNIQAKEVSEHVKRLEASIKALSETVETKPLQAVGG